MFLDEKTIGLKEPPKKRLSTRSPLKVDETIGAFSLVAQRTCGGFADTGGKVSTGSLS